MRNDHSGATKPQNVQKRKPDGKNGQFSRGHLAGKLNRWKNRLLLAFGFPAWYDVPPRTGYYLMAKQVDGDHGRVVAGDLVEIFVRNDGTVVVRKAIGRWVAARNTDRTGWVQYYGPMSPNPPYFWGFR